MSPRELFDRAHRLVRDYDVDGFAELFAPDAVMQYPFAPAGSPRRLEGQEAIRAFLATGVERARLSGRRIRGLGPVVVHETSDPEVIVVEFDQEEENTAAGRSRQVSFIQVIRVRDGRIVSYRDYMDYPALGELSAGFPPSDPVA